jgi:acyl carrier protein
VTGARATEDGSAGYYGEVPDDKPSSLGSARLGRSAEEHPARGHARQEPIVPTVDLDATVRGAVTRRLDVPPEQVTVQTLLTDLGMDDERGLAVLVDMENALDVRFPDDFLEGLHTYGDLESAVRRAIGG